MKFRFASFAAALASLWLLGASSPVKADDFKLDPVHSSALFWAHHFNAAHVVGLFSGVTGTVKTGDNASFDISIDVNTIETKNDQRNADLKSPDWLDVKQFPTMTFKSTSVKKDGDKNLIVTGDLTIHGVTKSVTVNIENSGTGKGMKGETHQGFVANFSVKRGDYGINPKAPDNIVGEEVKIAVELECIGQ